VLIDAKAFKQRGAGPPSKYVVLSEVNSDNSSF
jgi:hypothetical protein